MQPSSLFASLSCSIVAIVLSSCDQGGFSGNNPGGTGPFDRNGNYVESWADNPSKWGKRNSSPVSDDVPPSIASNEQPPANAVPLSDSKPPTLVRSTSTPVRTGEVEVASRKREVEVASRKKEVTSKPKPKVVAKSTKPKSSSPSRYVVKQGDSLSLIAARNKTSVSALQRANGISGTLIHPGKSLVIPR